MEPTSHTTMHINWYDPAISKGGCIKEDVFYKDHPNFKHMPEVAQSPGTEKEHAEWWAWYKGGK